MTDEQTFGPIVYGSLTARDPSCVTKTLWTETGEWVAAEDFNRLKSLLERLQGRLLTEREVELGLIELDIENPAYPPGEKRRYSVKGWEHWQSVNRLLLIHSEEWLQIHRCPPDVACAHCNPVNRP